MNINRINIHNYYSNNGYLDNFGLIDVRNFWVKCVKLATFLYFTKAGVIALRLSLVRKVKNWRNRKWGMGRKSERRNRF